MNSPVTVVAHSGDERPNPAEQLRVLSPAELAVIDRAVEGLSMKAIAYELGMSPSTVSTRLGAAAAKMGAESRTALLCLAAALTRRAEPTEHALTRSEREIVALLREGLSNREIAARRSRSVRTVANQIAALLRKTSTPSRRALLLRLREW